VQGEALSAVPDVSLLRVLDIATWVTGRRNGASRRR
jgi:hypothetical protein